MSATEPWAVPTAEDLWMADQIEAARRAGEDEVRALLLDLADLADDLDRFAADPQLDGLPAAWRQGLMILTAKVDRALERRGVTRIAAVGERLDPVQHRVVEVCDGLEAAETIVRQVRAGYRWRGQVLRPAEVVTVAAAAPEGGDPHALDRD